jgi:dissimilatory sulfite reductase related protein
MATKVLAGKSIEVNDEGYLIDMNQWNKSVAEEIAKEEGITSLTEKHWKLIEYLRDRETKGEALSIRGVGKSGIVDIKEFYGLFPGAPLKKATKIAGIKKPVSCI